MGCAGVQASRPAGRRAGTGCHASLRVPARPPARPPRTIAVRAGKAAALGLHDAQAAGAGDAAGGGEGAGGAEGQGVSARAAGAHGGGGVEAVGLGGVGGDAGGGAVALGGVEGGGDGVACRKDKDKGGRRGTGPGAEVGGMQEAAAWRRGWPTGDARACTTSPQAAPCATPVSLSVAVMARPAVEAASPSAPAPAGAQGQGGGGRRAGRQVPTPQDWHSLPSRVAFWLLAASHSSSGQGGSEQSRRAG